RSPNQRTKRLNVDQFRQPCDDRFRGQIRLGELLQGLTLYGLTVLSGYQRSAHKRLSQHELCSLVVVLEIALLFSDLYLVERRLGWTIASLFARASRGVALDDVGLAQTRTLFLAIGELRRRAERVEHPLAARHLPRVARRFARAGRIDDLRAYDPGIVRTLEQ